MITDGFYNVPCVYEKKEGDFRSSPVRVSVPGSKSISNRALLLATLASGTSMLRGVLFSDDSRHFLKCIQELGFETEVDEEKKTVRVKGLGGALPRAEASLYVGSAGTAARFLTAYLGVSRGIYHMDASEREFDSLSSKKFRQSAPGFIFFVKSSLFTCTVWLDML